MRPDDAVMFVDPTATAVTNPEFTVATAGVLEVHVAVEVMSTIPLQVVAIAENC